MTDAATTDPRRARRREDQRLLSGKGRYTGDLPAEDALTAVFVRAPVAHADIIALDLGPARAMPGVVAILSPEDLAADGVPAFSAPMAVSGPDGTVYAETPRPLLVQHRIRQLGEPLALVLAETLAAAKDAAEAALDGLDHAERPAIPDLTAAQAPDAPLVWPDRPGNRAYLWAKGDRAAFDAACAGAAHVSRSRAVSTRVFPVTMEPRGALAIPAADGAMTLHCGIQNARALRGALAKVFAMPETRIRVAVPDTGGSFGMKSGPQREEMAVFWAARRLGRPVRWTAERGEAMLSDDTGRDWDAEVTLALDAEGRFLALDCAVKVGVGAYASGRSAICIGNMGGIAGMYRTPVLCGSVEGLFANTATTAPYRGAGRPEVTYAVERAIDEAARALGLDRLEIRKRNLIPPFDTPYDTDFTFTYDSGDFPAVIAAAEARGDVAGFPARRAASEAKGLLRGLGIACPVENAGGPAAAPGADAAQLVLAPDGALQLGAGVMSAGQGLETAMPQLAAEALGIDAARIGYVQQDTEAGAMGKGMGGSSAMTTGAEATARAARDLIRLAREDAAEMLEAAAADIEYEGGRLSVAGTDRGATLTDIAAWRAEQGRELLRAAADFKPERASFPNGCHLAEVEIDPETGETRLVSYAAVEDIGTVMFPVLAEGQIHGGIVQGAGQALGEAVTYDEAGQLLTGSFMDYVMPRADGYPGFNCGFLEIPSPLNPFGAKGVGEAGTVGAMAAVMSAVCDALEGQGVSGFQMPATPGRVWAALQGRRA